jgi:hypothetical protein
MPNASGCQEQLVLAVEGSSWWRAEKAEQYPDDERNVSSSESLAKLAERLQALPRDDVHLVAYAEAIDRAVELSKECDLLSNISRTESQYIGRYGFDYPEDGDPSEFLESLTQEIESLIEDVEERVKDERLEAEHEAAAEEADEAAKADADEIAKEVAEEVAKKAAQEAYKEAYEKAYSEAYDEAQKEALIEALRARQR